MTTVPEGIPHTLYERLEGLKPILQVQGSIHRKDAKADRYVLRYSLSGGFGRRIQRSITLGDGEVAAAVAELLLEWRAAETDLSADELLKRRLDAVLDEMDAQRRGRLDWFFSSVRQKRTETRFTVRGALH